jgi:putative ABC transport system permease protein
VLTVTIADMRYRYRQFLIAVVGAGVVLAMAILLSGLAAGFGAEIRDTVGGVHADRWVLSDKAGGRLTALATFPQATVATIAHERGVRRASGLVLVPNEVARVGTAPVSANIMGIQRHGLGAPAVVTGKRLAAADQVVVDHRMGVTVGQVITIGSTRLRVVGTTTDRSLDGGVPIAYVALRTAQQIALGGRPLVTAVVTKGVPHRAPPGLAILANQPVEQQTVQTLASAVASIKNSRTMMWVVATIIVAALIYVSALQRTRDFAVLKALGSSSGKLFASLCLQAVLVTLLAAGFAAVACNALRGLFDQPVVIPTSAFLTLPLVAVVVGLLSSLVALRTATGADPVTAFGG